MFLRKLEIGNIKLENNIFLAPMAGITDLPFRKICKKFNPGLMYTEMASSKALHYNDQKTEKLLEIEEIERPIAIQIFGNDPQIMAEAANKVSEKADIIDINMGCPAPKVTKNGEGSSLLLNPDLVYDIVKEVVNAAEKPVTVKIRKGWDDEHINALQIATLIEKAGAKAITIHGRTRQEFYTGEADWDIIKQIKQELSIPVIGNGDITSEEKAYEIFEKTNCDGIMIGRGSLGNPWIFEKIKEYLKNGTKKEDITKADKLKIILEHIDLAIKYKGENVAVKEMRKHLSWYVKGMNESSKIRDMLNKETSSEAVKQILIEYFS